MKKQHVSSYLIYALCVLIFPSCSPEEGQLEIIPEAVNSGDSVVDNSARGTLSITSFSKDEEVGNDRVRSFRIAGGCVENTNLDVSIDSYSATTACQETGFYSFLVDLSSFENGIETVVISDGDNEVMLSAFAQNIVGKIYINGELVHEDMNTRFKLPCLVKLRKGGKGHEFTTKI